MVSLLLNSLLYLMVTLCTECHRIGGGIACASAIINLNVKYSLMWVRNFATQPKRTKPHGQLLNVQPTGRNVFTVKTT